MSGGRQLRSRARLLALLAETADDAELVAYRERLAGSGPGEAELSALRDLLHELGELLEMDAAGDEASARWERIEPVLAALRQQSRAEAQPVDRALAAAVASPVPPAAVAPSRFVPTFEGEIEALQATESISDRFRSAVVLPFSGQRDAPPGSHSPLEPVAALGATKPVGVDGAVPGSVMPFVPTGEVPTEALPVLAPPKLSLEQYASLCAEWQAAPARQRETLAKYGLSDAYSKTLLDVEWSRRLEQERALGQRFEQLVEQYLAWLNARR